jgi:chemosensory pili system protein ChpE
VTGAWGVILSAFSLGVAYNAAPGAVNTEALRRGLARGYRPALLVQLGALIGDATWAALALTGTAFLVQNRPLRFVLGVAGACFLLRLGWSALQEAWAGGLPRAHGSASRGDFATGAVFSLANPFALAFWTGIGAGLATTDASAAPAGRFALLFGGFVLGALLWCLCLPVVIGGGRRFIRPALFRWINALCGLGLSYFALTLFWHTIEDVFRHAAATVPRGQRE